MLSYFIKLKNGSKNLCLLIFFIDLNDNIELSVFIKNTFKRNYIYGIDYDHK